MINRKMIYVAYFDDKRGLSYKAKWKEEKHNSYKRCFSTFGGDLVEVYMHPKDAAIYMQRLKLNALLR